MSLFISSCSLFSINVETKIAMPNWPYTNKPDFYLVRYQIEGKLHQDIVLYGEELVLTLPKEKLIIFTAVPTWNNSFSAKPAGLLLRTGPSRAAFQWDSGALALSLFPLSDIEKLYNINLERMLETLKRKKKISIWDFDYNNIVKDLAEGHFNYYSIDRLETWSFEIPSNQGLWFPDDTDREVIEVTSSGIFNFELPNGSHRYISFDNRLIKEIYVNRKGELLVVDRPF